MASIIKDDKQLQALNEIEESLNVINQINQIKEGEGTFSITFSPVSGRTVSVLCDEEKQLLDILSQKKEKLVKDIKIKAKKYRIALSDEDYEAMGEKKEDYKNGH